MHTTNTPDTFITVAPDCPATEGTPPPDRANPSTAARLYRLLRDHPYRYTSDDLLFLVHAEKEGIPEAERAAARAAFFAKPRACLRTSDLGKRYGWGVHFDAEGRGALVGVETELYRQLAAGTGPDGRPVRVTAAVRSRR